MLRLRSFLRLRSCLGVLMVGLLLSACREDSGPPSGQPQRLTEENDSDQPIRLAYVCGNKFLITNALSVPVSISWRVTDTDEQGTASLPAVTGKHPATSERLFETRTRGSVEISLNGRVLRARRNRAVPCASATPAPPLFATGSAATGSWAGPYPWPVVSVHLHLLPSGSVLAWGLQGDPQVWSHTNSSFTSAPSVPELYCSGHTLLADGRVLVVGGHISNNIGIPDITIFNDQTGSWTSSTPMQRGRWYPTATTMSHGEVVITAGTDGSGLNVNLPEVWTAGGIRTLTGASQNLLYYPRAFLAPNGKLFYAGEEQNTRYLDISGSGSWTTVGPRREADREYGSAVMYDEGKILYAGGGRTTNTAETIDLTQSAPAWQWTGSMNFARRHLNLTVLANGEVLATGGVGGTTFNDLTKAVRAAEIWNPVTGAWTVMASSTVPRGYHTTSLLLPDGRVLHSGSGDNSGDAPDERSVEFFSPPYLFTGSRPTIATAPAVINYSTSFQIGTPDASSISKVSLIRLGSVTHAFNMNQRFQSLNFTVNHGGLSISAPTDNRRTPPGHYMLFILNGAGAPSEARIVQVVR